MPSLLIRGGTLHDGEEFIGTSDVLITDDAIEAVGRFDPPNSAVETIDAAGCIVAPGFIECHNMTQQVGALDGNDALNLLAQGITTCVIGNCGMSGNISRRDDFLRQIDFLRHARLAVNIGSLVGHNSLRAFAVSDPSRPSSQAEMQLMTDILNEALDAGFIGFSSGLMYAPGRSAGQDEMAALVAIIGRADKVYTSHIRDDGDQIWAAVTEALDTAKLGKARLVVSHLSAAGKANWGKAKQISELLEARRGEQEVYCSFYPYTAKSTILRAVIPEDIVRSAGGDFTRLRYNDRDAEILEQSGLQRYCEHGWDDVVVVSSAVTSCVGKSIRAISADNSPYAMILSILQQDVNTRVVFYNVANDAELRDIARRNWAMVASDGYVYHTGSQEATHPRNWGAFARVVKDYVHTHHVMTVEEFVRRVTTLPARVFKLHRRGALQPGYFADVVIFKHAELMDHADYVRPWKPATGVAYSIVNGRVAFSANRAISVFSGRCVS